MQLTWYEWIILVVVILTLIATILVPTVVDRFYVRRRRRKLVKFINSTINPLVGRIHEARALLTGLSSDKSVVRELRALYYETWDMAYPEIEVAKALRSLCEACLGLCVAAEAEQVSLLDVPLTPKESSDVLFYFTAVHFRKHFTNFVDLLFQALSRLGADFSSTPFDSKFAEGETWELFMGTTTPPDKFLWDLRNRLIRRYNKVPSAKGSTKA